MGPYQLKLWSTAELIWMNKCLVDDDLILHCSYSDLGISFLL